MRSGKILHPEHFDSTFFGCSFKAANLMDPRHRILLETTYECIVDAGVNPKELRGTNTGTLNTFNIFQTNLIFLIRINQFEQDLSETRNRKLHTFFNR